MLCSRTISAFRLNNMIFFRTLLKKKLSKGRIFSSELCEHFALSNDHLSVSSRDFNDEER